jgi:hypothetical protein
MPRIIWLSLAAVLSIVLWIGLLALGRGVFS